MVKIRIGNSWYIVVVVFVFVLVDSRNLPLKFGLNQVINRWDVVDVSVVGVVVVVIVIVVVIVVDPGILHLKFGWNWVSNSWYIADIEFVWVGGGGWVVD